MKASQSTSAFLHQGRTYRKGFVFPVEAAKLELALEVSILPSATLLCRKRELGKILRWLSAAVTMIAVKRLTDYLRTMCLILINRGLTQA